MKCLASRLRVSVLLVSACASEPSASEASAMREAQMRLLARPASFSVADDTGDAFSLPMPSLSSARLARFFVGNSFFNQNWVAAPASLTERDGLGPMFNARSCSGCHFKDGRGRPPALGEPLRSMILRIGVLAAGASVAHPIYGDQLQTDALPGVPSEARVELEFTELTGQFEDGESYALRIPEYQIAESNYGPLPSDLLISARVAPATIGLGLLEAVPEQLLSARADPDDRDRDGISGRLQRVPDARDGSLRAGRFGWKAEQPSVRAQVAGAFVADMGITSSLFPHENHSADQKEASARASGGEPELSSATLNDVVLYMRTLAVPAARDVDDADVAAGRALFERAACGACHTPQLVTGSVADLPELAQQTFAPYTDLLLHDLGAALSDQRPVLAALGSEWRTAPLWGVGLFAKVNGHQLLLHDGRARGVAEAILFHGGEGESSKRAFLGMSHGERAQLVRFVESL
jgi:CxxC motif-containing protein (DUF1111 family)